MWDYVFFRGSCFAHFAPFFYPKFPIMIVKPVVVWSGNLMRFFSSVSKSFYQVLLDGYFIVVFEEQGYNRNRLSCEVVGLWWNTVSHLIVEISVAYQLSWHRISTMYKIFFLKRIHVNSFIGAQSNSGLVPWCKKVHLRCVILAANFFLLCLSLK